MRVNGNGWGKLAVYVMVALCGAIAGAFTRFETKSDHDRDLDQLLRTQNQIIERLDRLMERQSTESSNR